MTVKPPCPDDHADDNQNTGEDLLDADKMYDHMAVIFQRFQEHLRDTVQCHFDQQQITFMRKMMMGTGKTEKDTQDDQGTKCFIQEDRMKRTI